MSKSKTSKERMTAAERRQRVVELRKEGHGQRAIADMLGCAVSTVCKDLKFALDEYRSATADEINDMRALDNARIEELLAGIYPKAKSGQVTAIDRAIKLLERRAKLNGLDGVVKVAPTDPTGQNPYQGMSDEELLRELAAITSGQTKT